MSSGSRVSAAWKHTMSTCVHFEMFNHHIYLWCCLPGCTRVHYGSHTSGDMPPLSSLAKSLALPSGLLASLTVTLSRMHLSLSVSLPDRKLEAKKNFSDFIHIIATTNLPSSFLIEWLILIIKCLCHCETNEI